MPLDKKEAAVSIVLNNDKKVLILKRSSDASTFPGYWNFPGGRVEEGEPIKEAAVRELREESGLEVKSSDLIYLIASNLPNLIIHYFLTSNFSGQVVLNKESTEYQWVDIYDVLELKMIPMSLKIIDDIHYYIEVLYES